MQYVCSVCGYVYDEDKEKIPFSELPESWECPICGAPKIAFAAQENNEKKEPDKLNSIYIDDDMVRLSSGEFSAICSNLARGCEKQYKDKEAMLYKQIADFFASSVPVEKDAKISDLSKLLENDLNEGYKALKSIAVEVNDRGTLRICNWGEKVSNILYALVKRYEKEKDEFLKNVEIWVCSVCGFIYIGNNAPELCPVCKVPSWKFEKIEGRNAL